MVTPWERLVGKSRPVTVGERFDRAILAQATASLGLRTLERAGRDRPNRVMLPEGAFEAVGRLWSDIGTVVRASGFSLAIGRAAGWQLLKSGAELCHRRWLGRV